MISVLVVEDDRTTRVTLEAFLETLGYSAESAATAREARELVRANTPDIVLLDVHLPDAAGFTLLQALRDDDAELGIIMLTGRSDLPTAVKALQQGALDVLVKPFDLDALQAAVSRVAELLQLRREVQHLRSAADKTPRGDEAQPLERLIELASQNDDLPVLIVGDSGTLRGYLARQIHVRSARASHPFIEASPSAAERDLFGHERGAFTDSTKAKRGLLEIAHHGTVFLDGFSNLSAEGQAKLLELLEGKTYRRFGGTRVLHGNARVIAAAPLPLDELVRSGHFRADLAERLQVLALTMPSPAAVPPGPDFSLATAEREAIRKALAQTSGNRLRAAELLGIARSTLQEKLKSS